MKDKSIRTLKFIGLGFLEPLIRLFSGEEPRKNLNLFIKSTIFPLASILLFITLWHAGAKSLYNKEAEARIEKARTEQGEEAAIAMAACIESGNVSCQPNTLPSPAQVFSAVQALLRDHNAISEKKSDFKEQNRKNQREACRRRQIPH